MQQPLNSELILSKEQLYDMFQQILGVKKFEHQLLFNALQVRILQCRVRFYEDHALQKINTYCIFVSQLDSADEQAAAIRRELDGRMQKVSEMEKVKSARFRIHDYCHCAAWNN